MADVNIRQMNLSEPLTGSGLVTLREWAGLVDRAE